ncbi:hypothetical protein Q5752_005168 [Cryptotrichosporon argae]
MALGIAVALGWVFTHPYLAIVLAAAAWAAYRSVVRKWIRRQREAHFRLQQRRRHGIPDSDTRPFRVAHAAAELARQAEDERRRLADAAAAERRRLEVKAREVEAWGRRASETLRGVVAREGDTASLGRRRVDRRKDDEGSAGDAQDRRTAERERDWQGWRHAAPSAVPAISSPLARAPRARSLRPEHGQRVPSRARAAASKKRGRGDEDDDEEERPAATRRRGSVRDDEMDEDEGKGEGDDVDADADDAASEEGMDEDDQEDELSVDVNDASGGESDGEMDVDERGRPDRRKRVIDDLESVTGDRSALAKRARAGSLAGLPLRTSAPPVSSPLHFPPGPAHPASPSPRRPGEWADAAGVRWHRSASGGVYRLAAVRERRKKFNMPTDSDHPDAAVEHDVLVERWLTEDEYDAAKRERRLGWQDTPATTATATPLRAAASSASLKTSSPRVYTPLRRSVFNSPTLSDSGIGNAISRSSSAVSVDRLLGKRAPLATGLQRRHLSAAGRQQKEEELLARLNRGKAKAVDEAHATPVSLAAAATTPVPASASSAALFSGLSASANGEPASIDKPAFSFIKPAEDASKTDKPAASPAFSFGTSTASAETKKAGDLEDKPAFSIGVAATKPAEPAATDKAADKPAFSFGATMDKASSAASAAASASAPSFSFGAAADKSTAPAASTAPALSSSFGFGASDKPATPAASASAAAPSFSFDGAAPSTPAATDNPAPTFSFGAKDGAAAPPSAPGPAFSLAAPSAATTSRPASPMDISRTSSPASGLLASRPQSPMDVVSGRASSVNANGMAPATFSFGAPAAPVASSLVAPDAKPTFSFGTPTPAALPMPASPAATSSFSFGQPAGPNGPSAPAAPPTSTFSFGAPAASPAASPAALASSFAFGSAAQPSTPAAPAPGSTSTPAFAFGAPASTPTASSSFSFGGAPAAPSPSAGTPTAAFTFGASTPTASPGAPTFSFGAGSGSVAQPRAARAVKPLRQRMGTGMGMGMAAPPAPAASGNMSDASMASSSSASAFTADGGKRMSDDYAFGPNKR